MPYFRECINLHVDFPSGFLLNIFGKCSINCIPHACTAPIVLNSRVCSSSHTHLGYPVCRVHSQSLLSKQREPEECSDMTCLVSRPFTREMTKRFCRDTPKKRKKWLVSSSVTMMISITIVLVYRCRCLMWHDWAATSEPSAKDKSACQPNGCDVFQPNCQGCIMRNVSVLRGKNK